jgi:hypothetical protein
MVFTACDTQPRCHCKQKGCAHGRDASELVAVDCCSLDILVICIGLVDRAEVSHMHLTLLWCATTCHPKLP